MTTLAASWLPLSSRGTCGGDRGARYTVRCRAPRLARRLEPLGGQPHPADQAADRVGSAGRAARGAALRRRCGRGGPRSRWTWSPSPGTSSASRSPRTGCTGSSPPLAQRHRGPLRPAAHHARPRGVVDLLREMTDELARHPRAWPGSASGWAAVVRDRSIVGRVTLSRLGGRAAGRAGRGAHGAAGGRRERRGGAGGGRVLVRRRPRPRPVRGAHHRGGAGLRTGRAAAGGCPPPRTARASAGLDRQPPRPAHPRTASAAAPSPC